MALQLSVKRTGFAAIAAIAFALFATPAVAAPQQVSWSKCFAKLGAYECGTVQVPLDYDAPNGASISIALVRLRATDPSRRLGSLFFNPGGPGDSGWTTPSSPVKTSTPPRSVLASISSASTRAASVAAPPALLREHPPAVEPFFTPTAFRRRAEEEQVWIRPPTRYSTTLRPARRADRRPHVDRQRGPRPRRAAPRRRRRQTHLRRRVLRLVSRRHIREPLPGQGARARRRRRAGPDRLVDRARRRGGHRALLDAPAQRRRRTGDARRVLPAVRRGRACVRVLRRRGGAVRGARHSDQGAARGRAIP